MGKWNQLALKHPLMLMPRRCVHLWPSFSDAFKALALRGGMRLPLLRGRLSCVETLPSQILWPSIWFLYTAARYAMEKQHKVLEQSPLYVSLFFTCVWSLIYLISQSDLRALYDYNNNPSRWLKEKEHAWGGSTKRKALQAIYTIAFLCLLRADEVLKIKFEHITFGEENHVAFMKLTLPFRKTHQFGGMDFLTISFFYGQYYLYHHMCRD